MLDTGIDVPEVVNLVFFKRVYSKTKFWQMVGRGTRLCPDLFGPGRHKTEFKLFDYCGNLEYFGADPPAADGAIGESLRKRLFKARLDLVGALDRRETGATAGDAGPPEADLRHETAETLRGEVAAMNVDNFVVRPKRKLVEVYAKPDAWVAVSDDARRELADEVAGLPTELPSEPEEAKRFDLLLLRLQLAVLLAEPSFERLRDQVKEIAGLLEEKASIPMVREQMELIQAIQADEWWQDVTAPMLETVRKRLRDLVRLIEKARRQPVFTDFADELGEGVAVALPAFASGDEFERFRDKARAFLRRHLDHPAIHKLRTNTRLAAADLSELERMLLESGAGGPDAVERAKAGADGLGVFVRSLVGLDREAAKRAMAGFLAGKTLGANQIEFVNLVVDQLTERGVVDPAVLYEPPFTDVAPRGPDGLFTSHEVDTLVRLLRDIQATAAA
jgi:type I restriction enzyme R subunit